MKKEILAMIAVGLAVSTQAQNDYVTPKTIDGFYAQKTSQNGKWVIGQDSFGSLVISYDVEKEETAIYEAYYPGNGNCVANNGMIVGQDLASEQHAAVMMNGKGEIPPTLKGIGFSTLDAITPDGTRACGFMYGLGTETNVVPFFVNIEPDGTFGKPMRLPFPRRDFFGGVPQYATAVWISDDGKTIAGYVSDSSGFYLWPIVYKEEDETTWTYTQPSEVFFNTENIPLPESPDDVVWGENGAPAQPYYRDYMTEEEYQAYLEESLINPDVEPYDFMTPEENKAFDEAIQKFLKEADDYLGKKWDDYHRAMAKLGKTQQFSQMMALSPDGKTLVIDRGYTEDDMSTDVMAGYVQCIFDLEDNSVEILELGKGNYIIPTQVLPDGSIIAITSPGDFVPYEGQILLPGADKYITFFDYLSTAKPEYTPWLEDTLGQRGVVGYDENGNEIIDFYVITGWVSTSSDMSVIAGGLRLDNSLSYIFGGTKSPQNNGVETVTPTEEEDDAYYNLQGIRVSNPVSGLYIHKGKKVIIK